MYLRGNFWCYLCDCGQIRSPWNKVKVSDNLGATAVVPVAPVDTSLKDGYDNVKLSSSNYHVIGFDLESIHI